MAQPAAAALKAANEILNLKAGMLNLGMICHCEHSLVTIVICDDRAAGHISLIADSSSHWL